VTSQATLDEKTIEALLFEGYLETLKKSSGRRELHTRLKRKIADLASYFGLRAVREYRLKKARDDGRDALVDVVWLSGSTPVAAFEIDSRLRTKSLRKLLDIPAKFRFWIYNGLKDPTSFVSEIDLERLVRVMHVPSAPKRGSSMADTMQDVIGPLTVDQHIRQAIQHCWMALPEEERSLERVEQEIVRLVWRALKDVREDATAFGFAEEEKPSPSDRLARIRVEHPRAYERWTEEEDSLLRLKFAEGTGVEELKVLSAAT